MFTSEKKRYRELYGSSLDIIFVPLSTVVMFHGAFRNPAPLILILLNTFIDSFLAGLYGGSVYVTLTWKGASVKKETLS